MDFEYFNKLIRKHRVICLFFGKKNFLKYIYRKQTKQKLNLKTPQSFREKLQLHKLTKEPLVARCANKSLVRQYVQEKIGEEYLIPQYFCKSKICTNDLKKLPQSFIIKTTNGSGTNLTIINKNKEDLQSICNKMNSYTKIKYGYLWGEFFYDKTKNQIIAEKLLTKEIVYDYKIHCFRNNKGKFHQIIEVLWGPKNDRHKKMYDTNWKPLKYSFSLPPEDQSFPKPKQLEELLLLSAKLSGDFSYVRTDFYIVENKIFFGELTFIPTAGFGRFNPTRFDNIWGSWIEDNIIRKDAL